MGMLLLLMVLGAGALYYFFKVRRTGSPIPAFGGHRGRYTDLGTMPEALQPASGGSLRISPGITTEVTPADEQEFRNLCVQVQTAWGRQDLDTLRKVTTPEMLYYFSNALSDHTSQEVENRVEDVMVMNAETRESWTEDARTYATVLLHWKARDYTVSLAKQPDEPGSLIEGDRQTPTEMNEAWTFVRHQNGKWLLSAIQQVD
jgi:predicted lipid-binding transport protein (Tim44 family)